MILYSPSEILQEVGDMQVFGQAYVEACKKDLAEGKLTEASYDARMANFTYFQKNIRMLRAMNNGDWVGSLNRVLYCSQNLLELKATLATKPDGSDAYIEQVLPT